MEMGALGEENVVLKLSRVPGGAENRVKLRIEPDCYIIIKIEIC